MTKRVVPHPTRLCANKRPALKLALTLDAIPRQANFALKLFKQIGCVSGRNGEIRAAKALKDCEIYSNDLTVSIKEGPT
jgi:hypothetical protein